jgi:dTDP-4-dehydrorhamnose 3,5-epimerase
MELQWFDVPDVALITPRRLEDPRGFFAETWSERAFRARVADVGFVQDNHSKSVRAGTIRGLHFQTPPQAQGKLVRVVRGAILDIAVDIRTGSPARGRSVAVELSATSGGQLWVPAGFLHGFCTLEDDTEVVYKVTAYYSADHDAGVLWDDPDLGLRWPVGAEAAILSDKDRRLPRLRDLPDYFVYPGADGCRAGE